MKPSCIHNKVRLEEKGRVFERKVVVLECCPAAEQIMLLERSLKNSRKLSQVECVVAKGSSGISNTKN